MLPRRLSCSGSCGRRSKVQSLPLGFLWVDQIQISAGHSFDFGVDVDIGYKFMDDEGVESHVVGVLLHYAFDFAVPD